MSAFAGRALKPVDEAPLSFIRARIFAKKSEFPLFAALFDVCQSAGQALCALLEAELRLVCRSSLFLQLNHLDIPAVGLFGDGYAESGRNFFAGLGPAVVYMNLATIDGLHGELAGFKKTHSPKPLIQSLSVWRFLRIGHAVRYSVGCPASTQALNPPARLTAPLKPNF